MNAPRRAITVRSTLATALAIGLLLPAGAAYADDTLGADAPVTAESTVALTPDSQAPEAIAAAEETPAASEPLPVVTETVPTPQEEMPPPTSDGVELPESAADDSAADPAPASTSQESVVSQARSSALPELPGSSIAAAMLPKRSVSGTVTDANGLPVPAEVTLTTGAGPMTVMADPNGAFTIPDVPVGNYSYQTYFPGTVSVWGTATLTPQTGERLNLVLSLHSQVSGRVVDINGQGIMGARVVVQQVSGHSLSTSTAADGSYTIQGIEPGQGTVQFMGAPGSVFASTWWTGASASSEATMLTFPKTGTALTDINAQLHAAAVATGYVLMPDDTPVDLAVITVRDSEGSIVFSGDSDATGRYATTGLPLGDYTVQASKWVDADSIELISAEQHFTMSGQPYNLEPLVLDRELEADPVPVFHAVDDSYSTPKNTLLQVSAPGVLANDDLDGFDLIDPEEAAFVVEGLVVATTHGEVLIAPDGSFVYQPDDDFVGTDTFTYKLWDLSSIVVLNPNTPRLTATVTITVGAENGGGGDNDASDPNGGTGTNGSGNGTWTSGGATTNGANATADRLAQTGSDSTTTLWVIGIAAFLLLDGAVLLFILRRRNARAAAALEGLDGFESEQLAHAPQEGTDR